MSSLKVHNLRYSYPIRNEEILKGISFTIDAPDMFSIVGENLSGKTTLANVIIHKHLNMLEGNLWGTIDFFFETSKSNFIGLLFEYVNWMFCNHFVDEEVAFGLENLSVEPSEMRRRVNEALELTGLSGFQKRQINTLSGGGDAKAGNSSYSRYGTSTLDYR